MSAGLAHDGGQGGPGGQAEADLEARAGQLALRGVGHAGRQEGERGQGGAEGGRRVGGGGEHVVVADELGLAGGAEAGGAEEGVEGEVDAVEELEGAHGAGVLGGVDGEGAEERGGVVLGVDDGLAGAHPLSDPARHQAVEDVLEVGAEVHDLDLGEELLPVEPLLRVSAPEEDAKLQAQARGGPDAG